MNLVTIFNLFTRDFRKQRKRIVLTLVALTWGTISIMLLLAFGEGLHQQMSLNRKGMGDNIAVVWGGQTSKAFKGMGKGRPIRFQEDDPAYLARSIPEIRSIGGEYSRWGVRITYEDKVLSEHVTGIPPSYEEMRYHIPQAGGRMINQIDMDQKRRVAFLGSELRERLFGQDDPVGKQIMVNNVPFTVIGAMIEKQQMNNYEGMDEDICAIPATTFKTIFGYNFYANLVVKPHDPSLMPIVEEKMYEVMGARYKFDPTDESALGVWDTIEGSREFNNVMVGIKIFLGIIGFLTLLIAGVGVANIMYVSIKERTREIGIKIAVGAKKSLILSQFLLESLMITFMGGLFGMLASIAMTEGFKSLPMQSDILDFMGRPTVSIEIGIAVIVILGMLGTLAGFFPALKAASVSPVEALRYE